MRSILKEIKLSFVLLLLLGSAILAFGLYNIHSMSNVTEGGILGLTLLLEYWFGISPSVSGFVLTILCYFLGWKLLGKRFLIYSFISSIGFSVFYRIFEQFDPLFPNIGEKPLLAAVVESGVEAKIVIQNGEVLVNGRPELQRGKKLTGGEVISYNGQEIRIEK